jgi:DNA repair ATPase RecN
MYDTNEKDRIDNIDKINQKIRSILDCLNDNEKTKLPTKLGDNKKRIKA